MISYMAENNFILPSQEQTDTVIPLHHYDNSSENSCFSQSSSVYLTAYLSFLPNKHHLCFVCFVFQLEKKFRLPAIHHQKKVEETVLYSSSLTFPICTFTSHSLFATFSTVSLGPFIFILGHSFWDFTSSVKQVPIQNPKICCSVLSFDNQLPTPQYHILIAFCILIFLFLKALRQDARLVSH